MISLLCLAVLAPETITIADVAVIDATNPKPRLHQYVTIADGKITGMGTKKTTAGKVINGKGKFLIPALWDMHVHGTGTKGFPELYIANGVVGVRDMFSQMSEIKKARQNPVGLNIIAAGRIVDGPKPIWPGSVAVSNADEGRKAVETVKSEGSDFVKVYSLLSKESYFAIAEEANKQKMVFAGHVPNSVSVVEASEAGQKSMEHLYGILKACSSDPAALEKGSRLEKIETTIRTYDPAKAAQVFATFKKNNTWHCPTMVVLRNIANLRDPAMQKDERLVYMAPFIKAFWKPENDFRFKAMTDDDWKASKLSYERQCSLLTDMHKAGVRIIAGTDAMNPYVFPGFSLHDELELYVKAGITCHAALQTATLNPALYLGQEAIWGTIAKGKRADLVLLDANPLADIRNTRRIRAVINHGQLYDRAALDALLKRAKAQ